MVNWINPDTTEADSIHAILAARPSLHCHPMPKLPLRNALNDFYGTPELFGCKVEMLGFALDIDLFISDLPSCPFCGHLHFDGYLGQYGRDKMGVIVCRQCRRVTDGY